MGYIVIDTETNGTYVYKYPRGHDNAGQPYPADGPHQARVAELAIVYCDDEFRVEREYQTYIKPDGWIMDPASDAYRINGLRTEFLEERGIPMVEALAHYQVAILSGRAVVAYNAQFDCKAMRGEARRLLLPDLFERTYNVCAMRSAMTLEPRVEKLGDKKGGYPKLTDVAAHFGIPYPQKHSALDDARVTVLVAKALQDAGALLTPAVHRAKNYNEGAFA